MDTIDVLIRLAWLAAAASFVIGLMRMNSPATARDGNRLSAGGMTLARKWEQLYYVRLAQSVFRDPSVSLEDAAGQASAELEQVDRARFMELIATGAVNELADLALWGDALSVLKAFRPELRPRARLSLLGVIFRSWLRR